LPEFRDRFPLVLGTKRPACKWSEKWEGPPPSEPYGLPTGARNDVWVLDIDRKNGVDGLANLNEYAQALGEGLPDTYTVATPNGGFHLYFAWDPERPVGNHVGVVPGIDTRGEGGYVCAGDPYVVVDASPVVSAPEWLYALVTTPGDRKSAGGEKVPGEGDRSPSVIGKSAGIPVVPLEPSDPRWDTRVALATSYLDAQVPCVSGNGGQGKLWEVALRLARTYELPCTTLWELFQPYNARCVPPWEQWEAERAFTRAAQIGTGIPGTFDASALAPVASEVLAPLPVGEWRRRARPDHAYSFDIGLQVAGGANAKENQAGARELGSVFAGQAAAPGWVGVWQYDTFAGRIVAVNPPMPLDAETQGLTRADTYKVQVWLACAGLKASTEQIVAAVTVAAQCAPFHPIRDYFAQLPSVPVADAEAYFAGIAGRLWGAAADRDQLESDALRRMAIAAARRVRVPGTKVDECLILTGAQGFNKSRFCAHLFDPYFRDQMPDLNGRDASHALEGFWGIEMAELTAMNRTSVATVKEFLTRTSDRYRQFGNGEKLAVPRQCVFIATTNEDDFFRDPTGESRYNVCEIARPIDLSWSRDEWWAAACALEASGASHYRDRALAPEVRDARHAWEDPWAGAITAYAITLAKKGELCVRAADVLTYGIPLPLDKQGPEEIKRVQAVLRRTLGPSSVRRVGTESRRVYSLASLSAHQSNASASSSGVIFFPSTAGAAGG